MCSLNISITRPVSDSCSSTGSVSAIHALPGPGNHILKPV